MIEQTDRSTALYRAFLDGDGGALEELVKLHGDALTRFAYCIVRDDAAAEDVTADTFAALIVKRKKFREDAKFRTYLYAIARNRCIDYLRKHGRNRSLEGLENVLAGTEGEEGVFAKERSERVYASMQKLPAPYKEVLYLHYFDGFSARQICTILKKGAKQVYNLLNRARSALRRILLKEGFSYEDI